MATAPLRSKGQSRLSRKYRHPKGTPSMLRHPMLQPPKDYEHLEYRIHWHGIRIPTDRVLSIIVGCISLCAFFDFFFRYMFESKYRDVYVRYLTGVEDHLASNLHLSWHFEDGWREISNADNFCRDGFYAGALSLGVEFLRKSSCPCHVMRNMNCGVLQLKQVFFLFV